MKIKTNSTRSFIYKTHLLHILMLSFVPQTRETARRAPSAAAAAFGHAAHRVEQLTLFAHLRVCVWRKGKTWDICVYVCVCVCVCVCVWNFLREREQMAQSLPALQRAQSGHHRSQTQTSACPPSSPPAPPCGSACHTGRMRDRSWQGGALIAKVRQNCFCKIIITSGPLGLLGLMQ